MLILEHSMCFWPRRKALSKWPWCMGKSNNTCGGGGEGGHVRFSGKYSLFSGTKKKKIYHTFGPKGGSNRSLLSISLTFMGGKIREAVMRSRSLSVCLSCCRAHLVPVFSFGENEVFDQVANTRGTWLRWTQETLQGVMGVSLPLFHARGIFQYSFGLMPYRKPIHTIGELPR